MVGFNKRSAAKTLFDLCFFCEVCGHLAPKPLHYCDSGRSALADVIFCEPWQSLSSPAVFSFNCAFTLNLQLFELTVHVNCKTQTVIL